jgi:hypothetical protein
MQSATAQSAEEVLMPFLLLTAQLRLPLLLFCCCLSGGLVELGDSSVSQRGIV